MRNPFKIGDIVRIISLHEGLANAPPEVIAVYQNAFMRPLRVDGVGRKGEDEWVELNVNDDGSQASDWEVNTLCLPPDEVTSPRGITVKRTRNLIHYPQIEL